MDDDLEELIDQILLKLLAAWRTERPMLQADELASDLGTPMQDVEEALDVLRSRGWAKGPKPNGRGVPTLAMIEPAGIDQARKAPGRVIPRRRRRILAYMLQQPRGSSRSYRRGSLAEALGMDEETLAPDLEILSHLECVKAMRVAQDAHPIAVELKATGIRVVQEGWEAAGLSQSTSQTVNNYGSGNVTSLAGRDSIQQHIQTGAGRSELRQLLGELKAAIEEASGLADDTRDDGLDAVDRIAEELAREQPRRGRIESALRALSIVADVAGTAQGAAMVSDLVGKLTPHVNQVCQALT